MMEIIVAVIVGLLSGLIAIPATTASGGGPSNQHEER